LKFYRAVLTVLKWTFFLCLIGGTVFGVYLYSQINDRVRLRVLADFKHKFPHLEISLGSAELVGTERIICRKLIFCEPARNREPKRRILEIEEIVLHCPITLEKYWNDALEVESAELNHPRFFLSRDSEGNLREKNSFLPVKDHRKEFPLTLRNGTIEMENLLVRDISATITPIFLAGTPRTGTPRVADWKFEATASGDWFRRGQVEVSFDPQTNQWTTAGSLQQLQCNRDLWAFLESWKEESNPKTSPTFDLAGMIRSIRGESNFTFNFFSDETAQHGFRGNLEGSLLNGRVQVEFLKQPVSELGLLFKISDEGIRINNCRGIYGDTEILFAYQQPDLSGIEGAALRIKSGDAPIDKELIGRFGRFLPKNLEQFLHQFRQLSINANLETTWIRQNQRWIPEHFLLQGTDLSLQHADSSYRIDGLAGKILLDHTGLLSLNFQTPLPGIKGIPRFVQFTESSPEPRYGQNALQFSAQFPPPPFSPSRSFQELNDFPDLTWLDQTPQTNQTRQANEEQRIRISGEFHDFLTAPDGNIQIETSAIPINAQLFEMIPEKQRAVVQSLQPEGMIDMIVSLGFPKDWATVGIQKHFEIQAKNCSICYDNFPYPVRGIYGTIEWNGTDWTFRDFYGDNESTRVRADGYLRKNNDDFALSLRFFATDLPLEGRLREALKKPSYREIFQSIRGSGKINVDAQILFFPTTNKLHVSFDATCDKVHGITICPVHFPYRIENVYGQISFDNGAFTVKNLKGRNKDTKFASDVYCQFTPEGAWSMEITDLHIDQISVQDNDLLRAIPEHLRQFMKNLRMEGPLNFDGAIRFSKAYAGAPLLTRWDTSLTLFQNAVSLGVPIRNIAGRIHLLGENDSVRTAMRGELELDSAFYSGIQFLNITGPFLYDGQQILFGQNVAMDTRQATRGQSFYRGQQTGSMPAETPTLEQQIYGKARRSSSAEGFADATDFFDPYKERRLNFETTKQNYFSPQAENRAVSASVFDGTAYCRGGILLGPKTVSYDVQMDLIDGGLSQFFRDYRIAAPSGGLTRKNVSGLITASAKISGEGRNTDTLRGDGFIALRNATIYETPTMIKLLQILSVQEPSNNAFSSGDVRFRIQGKKMLLNSVIFQGDAFSLEGNGDLQWDTNRKINLILHPKLGNPRNRIPILSDLIGGAGEQLNAIHVEGSLGNPDVIRIPLPGMRNAIEQIQGDI